MYQKWQERLTQLSTDEIEEYAEAVSSEFEELASLYGPTAPALLAGMLQTLLEEKGPQQ